MDPHDLYNARKQLSVEEKYVIIHWKGFWCFVSLYPYSCYIYAYIVSRKSVQRKIKMNSRSKKK